MAVRGDPSKTLAVLGNSWCGKQRLPGTDNLLTPSVGYYNTDWSPKAIFINKKFPRPVFLLPSPQRKIYTRFLEINPALSPSIFFFSYDGRIKLSNFLWVTEENNQQVTWHHFPVWISRTCSARRLWDFFIYVNPRSSLLSQSLLHHFKKAKEIKGINCLLKQALFLVLKSSVKKYKIQLQQELKLLL